MNFQTPLARARGLGSAREGSHYWQRQRVTAVALAPLAFWLAFALARLPDASYVEVVNWINAPWNAVLLLSFIFLAFFHAMLGLQIVIEDYVHIDWLKMLAILGVRLMSWFLALAAGFAVLRIVFEA